MAPSLVNGLDKSAPAINRAAMLKTCCCRFGSHYIAWGQWWKLWKFHHTKQSSTLPTVAGPRFTRPLIAGVMWS